MIQHLQMQLHSCVTAGSFLPVLVTKVYKVGKTDGTNYTASEIDKRVIALF